MEKFLRIFVLWFCCMVNTTFAAERVEPPVQILVLLSYHASLPWSESFVSGLEQAQLEHQRPIQYYVEYMDSIRLGAGMDDAHWLNHLKLKYQDVTFDAAIAESARASQFLNQHGDELLGTAAQVYYSSDDTHYKQHTISLKSQEQEAVSKTLQLALKQNPFSQQITIIDASDIDSQMIMEILTPLVTKLANKKISIIKDFTHDELLQSVASLPANSLVFYNLVFEDKNGQKFIPRKVLAELAAVSAAPIYSFWSPLMGSGVVGGHMIDGHQTAKQMVQAAMDYLHAQQFQPDYNTLQTFIDWKAAQQHGIHPELIPNDAIVSNKPPSLLKAYAQEIKIIAVFVIIMIILTTAWLSKLTSLNHKLQQQKQRAENLAHTDDLTGMNNRRAFFQHSEHVLKEAHRLQLPVSIILLDIDHFKKINDNYGHSAGDVVLQKIASLIESAKRDIDISARFGGEEFILLLPFSDSDGALHLAQRIRKACEACQIIFEGKTISFTVSAGVFCDPVKAEPYSINEAISYADKALYQSKQQGRNRVSNYVNTP